MPHDSLRRSCEVCERDDEIDRLTAERDALRCAISEFAAEMTYEGLRSRPTMYEEMDYDPKGKWIERKVLLKSLDTLLTGTT